MNLPLHAIKIANLEQRPAKLEKQLRRREILMNSREVRPVDFGDIPRPISELRQIG
jgi:hypothetical protein